MTLWSYHPTLRKVIRLAVMDVDQENTENMTNFWKLFHCMLREVKGDDTYMFNPIGFIYDEHHAKFHAIKNVFGEGGAERIRTCEIVVVIMCTISACAERR